MSADLDSLPKPLTFTYREDEIAAYSRLISARQETDTGYTFWGLVFAVIFAIGLIVLAVNRLALITTSQVPTVLVTAYIAFFAGAAAFYGTWLVRYRQAARKINRESNRAQAVHAFTFDAAGILWTGARMEARIPWDAIESVVWRDPIVLLWTDITDALAIPGRVFADDEARKAFIASVSARIAAAKAAPA